MSYRNPHAPPANTRIAEHHIRRQNIPAAQLPSVNRQAQRYPQPYPAYPQLSSRGNKAPPFAVQDSDIKTKIRKWKQELREWKDDLGDEHRRWKRALDSADEKWEKGVEGVVVLGRWFFFTGDDKKKPRTWYKYTRAEWRGFEEWVVGKRGFVREEEEPLLAGRSSRGPPQTSIPIMIVGNLSGVSEFSGPRSKTPSRKGYQVPAELPSTNGGTDEPAELPASPSSIRGLPSRQQPETSTGIGPSVSYTQQGNEPAQVRPIYLDRKTGPAGAGHPSARPTRKVVGHTTRGSHQKLGGSTTSVGNVQSSQKVSSRAIEHPIGHNPPSQGQPQLRLPIQANTDWPDRQVGVRDTRAMNIHRPWERTESGASRQESKGRPSLQIGIPTIVRRLSPGGCHMIEVIAHRQGPALPPSRDETHIPQPHYKPYQQVPKASGNTRNQSHHPSPSRRVARVSPLHDREFMANPNGYLPSRNSSTHAKSVSPMTMTKSRQSSFNSVSRASSREPAMDWAPSPMSGIHRTSPHSSYHNRRPSWGKKCDLPPGPDSPDDPERKPYFPGDYSPFSSRARTPDLEPPLHGPIQGNTSVDPCFEPHEPSSSTGKQTLQAGAENRRESTAQKNTDRNFRLHFFGRN